MCRLQLFGLLLVGGLGFVPITAAQNDPPAKPEADPFRETKKESDLPRLPAGHRIELSQPLKAEASLEERLEAKGSFQAEEAPLRDIAGALEKTLDTSVVLSIKKLEEAAINVDTPLTYKLKNVRLQTGLKLILTDLGLTYLLHENVLLITTPEDAAARLVTRVYDCRDLMKLPSPVKKLSHWREKVLGPGGGSGPRPMIEEKRPAEEVGPDGNYEIGDLMAVISATVSPDSWDEVGGPGTITDFKGLLSVSTTQGDHEKVEKLLNMLHKAGGLEGKVKVSR